MPQGTEILACFQQLEFASLPIMLKHVEALRLLPTHHGDPFDRMLAAQCLSETLTLITADKRMADYPITLRRVGF